MTSIILIHLVLVSLALAQPFARGVNLAGWFQSANAKSIQFGKFSKQDFINLKSLGCDVIRLPISMHSMTNGYPNYKVDPILFYFLDRVVDWAEELKISLILDNHSFDPKVKTKPEIENILIPVWKQFAAKFKDRSNLVFYEILNEPHGIEDQIWNNVQQRVIDEIRKIDSVHTIIVGPADWNNYKNLHLMPEFADENLIYTFHFYEPFLFTHQGANWTNPSLQDLKNIPFPYEKKSLLSVPPSLKNTWVENRLKNYSIDGTI